MGVEISERAECIVYILSGCYEETVGWSFVFYHLFEIVFV